MEIKANWSLKIREKILISWHLHQELLLCWAFGNCRRNDYGIFEISNVTGAVSPKLLASGIYTAMATTAVGLFYWDSSILFL